MKKAIFKFTSDCGRMGELNGIFVSTQERVDCLIDNKIEVYYGEVLGKHSEVYGAVEPGEIQMITNEPAAVDLMEKFKLSTGTNPFNYTAINFEGPEGDETDYEDMMTGEIVDHLLSRKSK